MISKLGAHACLGADALREAVIDGADVVVTGRASDSARISAELLPILDDDADALAGASAVGHLLECSGQVTGGNFEMPDGTSLSAREFADLRFPPAQVDADGSAEIGLLDGAFGAADAIAHRADGDIGRAHTRPIGAQVNPDGVRCAKAGY